MIKRAATFATLYVHLTIVNLLHSKVQRTDSPMFSLSHKKRHGRPSFWQKESPLFLSEMGAGCHMRQDSLPVFQKDHTNDATSARFPQPPPVH
jgi:hypothetical protein